MTEFPYAYTRRKFISHLRDTVTGFVTEHAGLDYFHVIELVEWLDANGFPKKDENMNLTDAKLGEYLRAAIVAKQKQVDDLADTITDVQKTLFLNVGAHKQAREELKQLNLDLAKSMGPICPDAECKGSLPIQERINAWNEGLLGSDT